MSLSTSLREYQTLTAQQWLDRATQTLPRAVTIILIVAIAWQLVQLTWMLLERKSDNAPTFAATASPVVVPTAANGPDVQAIKNAHLFGVPDVGGPTEAPKPAPANLVLSAVFATSDPTKGLAIIGESAQGAKVYPVGAVLGGGARLHQVFPDRVLLDRGGQLEELKLPKQNPAGLKINQPAPRVASTAPAPNQPFVDNLRRIAETDPAQFSQIVHTQPVFDKGVQRGFRVYPGRNRQMFAKLGLQPGDLVLSINSTPLDDPQRAQEMFNTIASSDRVNVTVERNGQQQELTLNTTQITLPDSGTTPPRASPGPAPGSSTPPSPPVE